MSVTPFHDTDRDFDSRQKDYQRAKILQCFSEILRRGGQNGEKKILYYLDHNANATAFFLANGIPAKNLVAINGCNVQCDMVRELKVTAWEMDINDVDKFPNAGAIWIDGTSTTFPPVAKLAVQSLDSGHICVVLSSRAKCRKIIRDKTELALEKLGCTYVETTTYLSTHHAYMVVAYGQTPKHKANQERANVATKSMTSTKSITTKSTNVTNDYIGKQFIMETDMWPKEETAKWGHRYAEVNGEGIKQYYIGKVTGFKRNSLRTAFMSSDGRKFLPDLTIFTMDQMKSSVGNRSIIFKSHGTLSKTMDSPQRAQLPKPQSTPKTFSKRSKRVLRSDRSRRTVLELE